MDAGNRIWDAVIVGGGPAGVSCAVWLARLGLSATLVEAANELGGLCRSNPFVDEWNASLPGMTGVQVADNLARSARQAGVSLRLGCRVDHIERSAGGYTVAGAGLAAPIRGRYLVLATGVRARSLAGAASVPDASTGSECHGPASANGILTGPGQHVVEQDFQGKRVAVLGGGDNAFENALYAMEHGAQSVRLYARTIRAQHQFVRKVPASRVSTGPYDVDAARRTVNGKPYDVIMVFYGWEPCAGFADGLGLHRSAQGFIATDMDTAQTSCPGVYAVGEVAQRQHPCVVTALADGVTAAKAIQARLESA